LKVRLYPQQIHRWTSFQGRRVRRSQIDAFKDVVVPLELRKNLRFQIEIAQGF
jgi:hypothetical protein